MSSGKKKDISERFGERLRALRLERGMTQSELASLLGLDRSYLSDLERGRREICLRNLEVIALGFGLKPSELLRKTGD